MKKTALAMKSAIPLALTVAFIAALAALGPAEEKTDGRGPKGPEKPGLPAALVEVSEITRGATQPMGEFVGTVYYARVSNLAAEVAGMVEEVAFEEGRRVRKGRVLVRLGTDLLETSIEGTRASYEQAVAELEKAEKDLKRMEPLFREGSISESAYDEHVYRVRSIEKKAASLKADLESLELDRQKKSIRSPFDGIVIERSVEKGEWVFVGGKVAVVADDSVVEAVVDVPSEILGYLSRGREVEVSAGGRSLRGAFSSYIPKGDVATRTFSVKVRLGNTAGLVEGMEARVSLPSGPRREGLIVRRDALIRKFGQDVVFVVSDRSAKMVPVRVTGYDGLMAGVEGPGLEEGMKAVVKGNERLQDGQPLNVAGQGPASGDKSR